MVDYSDRAFPIDFDELVVTRRVFRSGESVYMINNAACRLRDVQELFMDTGIGKGGYSMIGQGNVAQILSTKAEERREFFEGAAGVSKYKHRKDEAERKLESTNENLTRVKDITEEISAQIGPLESQSKKAKKYLEYYEEYKDLDVSMSVITLKKNAELAEKAKLALGVVTDEMDDLRAKGDETTKRVEELINLQSKKDEEKAEQNQSLAACEEQRMTAAGEITIAKNNISNNTKNIERIDREIAAQKKRTEEFNQLIKEKREKIELDKAEALRLEEGFSESGDKNKEIFERVSKKREEIRKLREEMSIAIADASGKRANVEGMEQLRLEYLARRDALEAERAARLSDSENIKQKIADNEKTAKETLEKKTAMKERVDGVLKELEDRKNTLSEIANEYSELTVTSNSMTSKKRILEGMENEYEGFARSVKLILKEPMLKKHSIYGTLSGLIEVEDDYVTAIETVLAGALQNIVVESEEDAKAAISFLKKEHGGRATFLPVSSVKSRRLENEKEITTQNGVVGIASDLVKCDKKYRGVVENLLGRTVVSDNIDSAIALSKKYGYRFRVVTTSGEILNAGGAISGGSVNKQSGFLSRANEIKELGVKLSETAKQLGELLKKREALENEVKNLEIRQSSYLPLLREYENDYMLAKNNAEHLKQSMQDSGKSGEGLENQLTALEKQIAQSGEELACLIGEERTLKRKAEECEIKITASEEELAALESEKENAANSVMEETLKIRELTASIEVEQNAIAQLLENIAAMAEEENSKLCEKAAFLEDNEKLTVEIDECTERFEEIKKRSERILLAIEEIDSEKEQISKEQMTIQESNKEFTERLVLLQQEYSRAETKCERISSDTENIIARLWEDYEYTITMAEENAKAVADEKEAAKRVAELKSKIKALGSVNIDAIEEYKAVSERYEFLNTQKADLEAAIENLNKIISSTKELMEEHFNKQFNEINKSFKKVFSELFGGG